MVKYLITLLPEHIFATVEPQVTKLGAVSVDLRSDVNDPINVELLMSSFEQPDILRQFRRVLAVLVLERCRMIVVPLLERRLGGTDVLLLAVISTNNRLVGNVVGEAVAFQGAMLRFTAIASPFLIFGLRALSSLRTLALWCLMILPMFGIQL